MTPNTKDFEPLAIDAANGVGALKLAYVRQRLAKLIQIEIFNDGRKGHLNENVKREKKSFRKFKKKIYLVWC